ncbi:MAG: PAS domain-containing protein, partial [Shewanella sp.]
MRIGNKILVFIAGFCLPAVVLVSYCLSVWFDHRVELLRQDNVQRELANIQQQFRIDVDRLGFLTNIYASPLAHLDSEQLKSLESSWLESSMSGNLSWFILRDGNLQNVFQNEQPIAEANRQEIAKAITTQAKPEFASAYLIGDKGYVVTAVASHLNEYVLLVRQLTERDLLEYAQTSLVARVSMSNAETTNITSHPSSVALPSLISQQPIYLHVEFSDDPFRDVKLSLDWVSLAVILLGILIVALGYVWLRACLLQPFKSLMQQLALVDPMASVYRPVTSEGNEELSVLASRVNSLLARIYQQKERGKITLESIAEAVILTDIDAKVIYMNPKAETLLDVASADAVGESLASLLKAGEQLNQAVFHCIRLGETMPQVAKIKLLTTTPRIIERSISNV